MEAQSIKKERIDIRVSTKDKMMFLHALEISGESSLSAFLTRIIKTKSSEIIEKHTKILTSERDKKIFFDAIFADQEPNKALKDAAKNINR